jgi:ABC-2 type transport system permease protein
MAQATMTATTMTAKARPRLPFLMQVSMMTWRTLVMTFRTPAAVLPSLIISGFFLLVYQATLGDAAQFLPGLSGNSYLGFILPLSIVSASLSGAGTAGQNIVRDIENGYFDKLMLTPVSRGALVLGPMIAGAVVLVIQSLLVTGIGLLLGLESQTGLLGLVGIQVFALILGISFAGFTVGIALQSGNAAATQGASFLFFPLTFLTATFVPVNLLSGWIRTAAEYNPITYVLEAMRALLLQGWDAEIMLRGLLSCVLLGVITYSFALISLRSRIKRK